MRKLPLLLCVSYALIGCGSAHPHVQDWGQTPKGLRSLPAPSSAPSVAMFDTVDVSVVPAHPFALAGYTSGFWPTYLPLRQRYPSAHTVSIAVSASHRAACLDVEPGDASPSQAGPWVRAGGKCVYGDLSNMPAIKANLRAWLGTNWRARVLLWLAWYTLRPGLVQGYDAVQWTDHALGRNLDESSVSLAFLRIAVPAYVDSRRTRLYADYRRRSLLRSFARHENCYRPHRKHACVVWGQEVKGLEADISRLHSENVF